MLNRLLFSSGGTKGWRLHLLAILFIIAGIVFLYLGGVFDSQPIQLFLKDIQWVMVLEALSVVAGIFFFISALFFHCIGFKLRKI